MKKTYYSFAAALVPGWKLPQAKSLKCESDSLKGMNSARMVEQLDWKSEPHVYLANLGYEPERRSGVASDKEVEMFTTRYGPLDVVQGSGAKVRNFGTKDPLEAAKQIVASSQPDDPFWLSLSEFRSQQTQLRDAWQRKDAALFTDPTGAAKAFGYDLRPITWQVRGNHLEMVTASCRDYIGILLARDLAEDRARICARPKCPHPYFVAARKDQKFCCHRCASDVAQNNLRRRRRTKRRKR